MSDFLETVAAAIKREQLLRAGDSVLVAVSGGCDSVVLLEVLRALQVTENWVIEVAHFNHQLRGPDADADADWVRCRAQALGLPFHGGHGDVRAFARQDGCSLEMAARALRHAFLARVAVAREIRTIALGHHGDDRVETLFLRLFRGSAGEGLAGMAWAGRSPANPELRLIRPLLDCTRGQIQSFAMERGLDWREDATNAGVEALRNRIRNHLLPWLERDYQPALRTVVRRFTEVASADAAFAAATARRWLSGENRQPFASLHRAVQRQVILQQLHPLDIPPSFDLVESLIAHEAEPLQVSVDRRVWREASGRLKAGTTPRSDFNPEETTVILEGQAGAVEFAGLRLAWFGNDALSDDVTLPSAKAGAEWFDAGALGTQVRLRHWQPGDRFQPIGMATPTKLQDLFVNHKVPREERHQRVIAETAAGTIFWVEGLRIGEAAKIRPGTRQRICWQWERMDGRQSSMGK